MILYVQMHGNDKQWYKIVDPEDLNPVFTAYPMTREIAMSSDTLQEAVEAIAEYLDGHNMDAWVESKEISKSLRNSAAALGIALGAAVPSSVRSLPHPAMQPSMHQTPVQAEADKNAFGTHPNDRFLWNIKQIESSGGANTNHKPIRSGKFKGTKAIGQWGLLKPTISEMVGRMRASGTLSPEYEKLDGMNHDQLEEHFRKNPKVELELARNLATHVLKRQGGNMHRAAYSWLHGHNLMPRDIAHDKLNSSAYVNKFRAMDQINPYVKKQPGDLKKVMQDIGDEDFKMRVKNWAKRREEELTNEPMRSSNFVPDPGRLRPEELDDIKADSQKTPLERMQANLNRVNKEKR